MNAASYIFTQVSKHLYREDIRSFSVLSLGMFLAMIYISSPNTEGQ